MTTPASSMQPGSLELVGCARVMVVEARYGSLRRLVQALQQRGVTCETVCGGAAAETLLTSDGALALAVTDVPEPARAMPGLRYNFPALPWVELAGVRSGAMEARAEEIFVGLLEHPYAPEVVDVISSTVRAQWSSFRDCEVVAYLRRDGRMRDRVCASVEVAGRELWGRLSLCASEKVLFRQARALFGFEPESADDVLDVAGEYVNRLAGVLRRHYREQGIPSTQGAPGVVAGEALLIRPIATTPSLLIEHRISGGDGVSIEWHLGKKPVGSAAPPYGQLPTGEPVYL